MVSYAEDGSMRTNERLVNFRIDIYLPSTLGRHGSCQTRPMQSNVQSWVQMDDFVLPDSRLMTGHYARCVEESHCPGYHL
jgi:hypothetical protein